ncbi:hypothetical protein E4U42_004988 [Claviceps africana]|uniref:Uncharacterized protein n=1 Tax=Claviceps africana TaxID=83212 RepID=A0A8K0J510_9HYPO|nr:hypothetical protein E4U42_004988 [Claviceps africana]
MSSAAVMATTALQPPIGPHSSYQVGGSTDSFFDMPQPLRPASGTGASSDQSDAHGDAKVFSSGLQEFDLPSFNADFELDTSIFANSQGCGPGPVPGPVRPDPTTQQSRPTTSTVDEPPPMPESKPQKQHPTARARKLSLMERPRSWLGPSTKVVKETADSLGEKSATSKDDMSQLPSRLSSHRSLYSAESFAHFARRPWISRSSRSPSPKNVHDLATQHVNASHEDLTRAPSKLKSSKSWHRLQALTSNAQEDGTRQAASLKPTSKPISRATSYLSKMKSKQQSSFFGRDGTDSDHSCASSATSLNRTSESIRTSASRSICSDGNTTNTPITDESCNETTPKLRDPLWPRFKSLDVELKSFNSAKQTATRVAQVQSILLPFLRGTRSHPSNKTIALEDVERRAVVLNKWWSSLLDMLQGPLPKPIPGMERPVLLEAATMLMMRPEWRKSTTFLLPLSERSPMERVRSRSWTDESAKSTTGSFAQLQLLAESAEHNVRTMFVANLVKQMAYVVEKMSLRHAPLSLVNFSGKTCAYAFFFAPGVADVLVRLWGLTPELIRRTGTELGLPRKDNRESDDIIALFPPALGILGWSSPRAVWDSLKRIPQMSLLIARIPWTGPWVTRWKGRDTDLFFIFCKYFHILSDQFTPAGLPITEKARAPAFALVHAQLLSIVDSTIHRQTGLDQSVGMPPLIDAVNGTEAAALALPLPPTNLMKSMSENRLVILLRDFFSEDASELSGAIHTYAETFAAMVKAAARKTSLYDNAACFALCDFLEEVLMVYHEFETAAAAYVDWSFWIDVCKKMSSSMNTMTEIRLLSFVFTVWDAMAKDPGRKASLCLDWLLTEESFNSFFNNWCPMVRAYYQRLVCWRMCRYVGQATDETDINIYLTAAARLKMNWAHYLYVKQAAEENGRILPSSAPMSPALGKKFMIIRQEANLLQKGLFMGFDTFARMSTNQNAPGTNDMPSSGEGGAGGAGRSDTKKRWSLFEKVLSMTSSNGTASLPDELLPKSLSNLTGPRRELVESASPVPSLRLKTAMSETDSLGSSPVYDEQRYVFKFILGWQQNPIPARDRILAPPRLPDATQAHISAKSRAPPPTSSPQPSASASAPASAPASATRRPSSPTARSSNHSPSAMPNPVLGQEGEQPGVASRTASVEEWLRNTPTSDACAFEGAAADEGDNMTKGQVGAASNAQQVETMEWQCADGGEGQSEQLTKPVKPRGIFVKNTVYCGRALAEWFQVVSEYNIFTERRQDDGVKRLCDVEVPFLGVDGFRKCGA